MAANVAANIAQKKMGEANVIVDNQDKQNKSETTDMLACCWIAKDTLEMKRKPKPELTNDEDVIVKITGTTGKKYIY